MDISRHRTNTEPYPSASKGVATSDSGNNEGDPNIAQAAHEIYEYAADVTQPKAGPNQARVIIKSSVWIVKQEMLSKAEQQ